MYDPESPWLTDIVSHVVQPKLDVRPQRASTVTWDVLRTDLKHLIVDHYKYNKQPMNINDIMKKLETDYTNLAVLIDQELLVVLLDNLGPFVTKH